ncbi:adenosine receptor A2b-like [Stylophora pistillata]|uniref:adenosine receptor A2b-like n=1 Tax=Stylophora pistillata TaxID=50429 RepID=UPI000C04145A|nr:adenosine receptor A2b-like [Stylophora pistillata]
MANITNASSSSFSSGLRPLAKDFCVLILPDPEFDKAAERLTTNLVTSVINVVLSPFGVITNFFIILVISRKISLWTPLNVLLGCLAASDFLVGLLVQPSYVAFRLMENQHKFVPCALRLFYSTGFFICYGVSLVTLCAISWERFLALLLPLKYSQLIRLSRVSKLIILIWLVNIFLTLLQWAHCGAARGIHLGSWLVLLLAAVASQLRILPIIRYHQKQIKKIQSSQPQTHAPNHTHMQVKFAANIACIVTVYLAFNLPVLLITAIHQVVHIEINTYDLYSWAETAAFFNSSVNPVICLWRVKLIRREIRELWTCRRERKIARYSSNTTSPDKEVSLVQFRRCQEPPITFIVTNNDLSDSGDIKIIT